MTDVITIGVIAAEAALVGLLYAAYRRRNTAAIVNAVCAIGVTLVPPVVGWALRVDGGEQAATIPTLTLAVALAGFLHCLGMLGLYESTNWWDHLTHTVSAALIAALLYAALRSPLGPSPEGGPSGVAAGTVLGTLTLGVGWELIELAAREVADRYGIEPVLVHYGWRDTAFDLLFDVVGALLVVVLDLGLFVPLVESILRAIGPS